MTTLPRNPASFNVSLVGWKVASLVRSEHALAALVLLAALFLCYHDVVFGGRTFSLQNTLPGTMPISSGGGAYAYPHDGSLANIPVQDGGAIAWVSEPYNRRTRQIIAAGEVPLWNPSGGGGEPLLADGNAAPFEPIQMLFYLAPERSWPVAMDVQVLLRFFLAGLFTYLFARRLGLSLWPAAFAGVSYMLSSYFLAYGNHPQMRAETLLPLAVYIHDQHVRRPRLATLLLHAGIVFWVVVASFPESGFLALALASLWYIYQAFWRAKEARFARATVISLAARLLLAVGIGLGLAAFFMLPLLENIAGSMHIHASGAGLQSLAEGSSFWQPQFYIITLAMAAMGVALGSSSQLTRRATWFFGIYGLLFFLKLFGFAPVQWIGLLPGFSQISLVKYSNPSIFFCLALVAAMGVERVLSKKFVYPLLLLTLVLCDAAVCLALVVGSYPPAAGDLGSKFVTVSLVTALVAVPFAALRCIRGGSPRLAFVFLLFAAVEPLAWQYEVQRPLRHDPFTPPPFVDVLRAQGEPRRIVGLDGALYPETPTAYGIDDIRFLAALLSERRFLFMNQFVVPGEAIPAAILRPGETLSSSTVEQIVRAVAKDDSLQARALERSFSRFTGLERPLYLGKYADLLNVAYVVSTPAEAVGSATPLLGLPNVLGLVRQAGGSVETVDLAGDARAALAARSGGAVALPVLLPSGHTQLTFAVAGPRPSPDRAGELRYRLTITDAAGEHELFRRALPPAATQPGWADVAIDLSPWSGQRVTLTFAAEGGDEGARAYWAGPSLRIAAALTPWATQSLRQRGEVQLNAALVERNRDRRAAGLALASPTLDGQRRNALAVRPGAAASLAVRLPPQAAQLRFALGVDPQLWRQGDNNTATAFRVLVHDGLGETEVFARTLAPQQNPRDRGWVDAAVDLGRWAGKTVTLRFATSGEPGSTPQPPAYWGVVELKGDGVALANPDIARFQLVYDDEVMVYQNLFAYPRAFVLHQFEAAPSTDAAIRRLSQPDFDPSTTAVVEGALPVGWTNPATPLAATPVEVVGRTANTLRIRANLERAGLLVVSETYNAGWQAYIDGQPSSVLPTDVFLRGVYVPAGKHDVTLVYAPRAFAIGSAISLGTLLLVCAALVTGGIRFMWGTRITDGVK